MCVKTFQCESFMCFHDHFFLAVLRFKAILKMQLMTVWIGAPYVPVESQYSLGCTWHRQKWCPSRSRCQQPHRTLAPVSGRSCSRSLPLRVTNKHWRSVSAQTNTATHNHWRHSFTWHHSIRCNGTHGDGREHGLKKKRRSRETGQRRLMGIRWRRQIWYGWPTFCVKRKEGKTS